LLPFLREKRAAAPKLFALTELVNRANFAQRNSLG